MRQKFILLSVLSMALLICQITYAQQKEVKSNQSSKGDVSSEITKAKDLLKEGKKDEASKVLTNIMKSNPDNKEAVQEWLIINMKRTERGPFDAIKQLDTLSRIYTNNIGILFWTAFLQVETGMNEEALVNNEKLIKLQPDTAVHWILKGQVLNALKKDQEALTAFNKALTLDQTRFDLWSMKASTQVKLKKFDDAISTYNKNIELFPKEVNLIYDRGCAYSLKGDKTNALKDLKKAIELNKELKDHAKTDEDFKSLWNDADFKKITE